MQKRPIHTTISEEAFKILERFEHELGRKNIVLEKALRCIDTTQHEAMLHIKDSEMPIKRLKTCVKGFDSLIGGGIPEGFIVIVTGPPGTGKTIFSLQFIQAGAMNNEKCIFFSHEESAEQLAKQALCFGWDMRMQIHEGLLMLYGHTMLTTEEVINILNAYKPKRIVFDSINIFSDTEDFRRSAAWRSLFKVIKQEKITCLLVTEKRHGLEVKNFDDYDFMGDCIIFMDKSIHDGVEKSEITVLKMRSTNINSTPRTFRFTEKGIDLDYIKELK